MDGVLSGLKDYFSISPALEVNGTAGEQHTQSSKNTIGLRPITNGLSSAPDAGTVVLIDKSRGGGEGGGDLSDQSDKTEEIVEEPGRTFPIRKFTPGEKHSFSLL